MCMYELIHSREEQGTTTAVAAAAGNSIRFSRVKMNEKKRGPYTGARYENIQGLLLLLYVHYIAYLSATHSRVSLPEL